MVAEAEKQEWMGTPNRKAMKTKIISNFPLKVRGRKVVTALGFTIAECTSEAWAQNFVLACNTYVGAMGNAEQTETKERSSESARCDHWVHWD